MNWLVKKHKKICTTLNHSLILGYPITGCVSISAFAPLFGISVGITSFAIGINFFAITTVIKKL